MLGSWETESDSVFCRIVEWWGRSWCSQAGAWIVQTHSVVSLAWIVRERSGGWSSQTRGRWMWVVSCTGTCSRGRLVLVMLLLMIILCEA